MENVLEKSIKDLAISYLETAKQLDKELVASGEVHRELSAYKAANPEAKASDLTDRLTEAFEKHKKASLYMRDVESYISRLSVLKELAELAGIEIPLDEDSKLLFESVKTNSKLFYASKNDKLICLHPEIVDQYLNKVQITDQILEDIFKSL